MNIFKLEKILNHQHELHFNVPYEDYDYSDYDDYYVIDKSEVSEQINNGEKFYNIVKSYVLERLERLDEAHIVNDGITDYEDGEIVDGKKSLKKMRDKYGI